MDDPLSLTLAADYRLTILDYPNDHIWEMQLGRSNPAAILLHTTYGLRAHQMRIFPQFSEKHFILSDPSQFQQPAVITHFFPNYLEISCAPFPGIDVRLQYWVPDCQTLAGRIKILNSTESERKVNMELVGLLNPSDKGKPMLPELMDAVWVLHGHTADLSPVIFITGGATGIKSPYPALRHSLELEPGHFRQFTWVQAALADKEQSFRHARATATRNWEAEKSKIEMCNSGQIQIYTGDPDWDAAFAFGQKTAYSLIYSANEYMQRPSFVSTRLPDQGYSLTGSGSDYNHLWNGQTTLEAWYLSQLLLPGEESIIKGLLRNFFDSKNGERGVDWKPGLAGQRAGMLAAPLLVSIAWRLYRHDEDKTFLEEIYPQLLEFVLNWFVEQHDRDGDGIPEWDNALQTGFEDNPVFAYWHPWAQGSDITLSECPDLCAYLYRECTLLIKMAHEIGQTGAVAALEALADNLRTAVEASWNTRRACYQYWDRESHLSQKGKLLKEREGSGEMYLDLAFDPPVRPMLRFDIAGEMSVNIHATLHGLLPDGQHRVERITRENIRWSHGFGSVTLKDLYSTLEHILIEGLPPNGKASLYLVDHTMEDHSSLLPLWAEIPKPKRAESIIKTKIQNDKQYHKRFGIPACRRGFDQPEAQILKSVWLPFNVMIGEGLLTYGARHQAVDLVSRIMDGIVTNLKREHSFRKHYHAEIALGIGEINALQGLPPLGLFLATLGVRIVSPHKLILHGFNSYPWPIRIKYQGLSIECRSDQTVVTFPDGQSITINDPSPCVITDDASEEKTN